MQDYKSYIPNFFAFIERCHLRVSSAYEEKFMRRRSYKYFTAITKDVPFCLIGPLDQSYNIGKRLTPEQYAFFRGTCASLYGGYFRHIEFKLTNESNRLNLFAL